MKFYMSGLSNAGDVKLLEASGIRHVLADQFDIGLSFGKFPHVALDSGAFYAARHRLTLDPAEYFETAMALRDSLDFVVSLDVIGDAERSWSIWRDLTSWGLECMPVWHFDFDTAYLHKYLDATDGIIGIGGLALTLRDKDNPARAPTLRALRRLCEKWPNRFHVFGLNWVKAINELREGLHSGDSSLWLRGARYSTLIFKNSRTGKLSQAPSWLIDDWARKKGKDVWFERNRTNLCRSNAAAIQRYCQPNRRLFLQETHTGMATAMFPRLRPRRE